MKKHIFGLAIFSFIVVAAAIIFNVFNVSLPQVAWQNLEPTEHYRPVIKLPVVTQAVYPFVTQAVYNAKTRNLNWQISSPDSDAPTVIHLFLENEKGIQRVHAFYVHDLSGSEQLNPFSELGKMLNKISSKTNLYVIADAKESYMMTDTLHNLFEFDSSRAVPVTIDYGK